MRSRQLVLLLVAILSLAASWLLWWPLLVVYRTTPPLSVEAIKYGHRLDPLTRERLAQRLPEGFVIKGTFADLCAKLLEYAPMSANYRGLAPLGITRSTPISLDLSGMRLAEALDAITAAIGPRQKPLAFDCSGGIFWLSTRDEVEETSTRLYDVRDLLTSMPLRKRPSMPASQKAAANQILQELRSAVRAPAQRGRAGSASLQSGQLIVTQTAAGHWETARFLERLELRRAWQFFASRAGTLVSASLLCTAAAQWITEARRRQNRSREGYCLACGYDLRASPERCPECGTTVAHTARS